MTHKARISQHHRATIDLKTWKASAHGHDISQKESSDVCDAVSSDGDYRGKWQMSRSLWRSYGGRTFARVPNRATCNEQDRVARHIWVDQWWWPWGG
ncbi:MAG: transglycosylase family protein [Actinomycetia bacterium]|nr:transglycosylase family protein [Actinomycetes bacterium]